MLRAQEEGALEGWGAQCVPSLPTLHRVIKRDLGAGSRVVEVARPAGARVGLEPSRYDRALADLGLVDGAGGLLVVDGPPAGVPVPGSAADAGVRGGGVRLYVLGARLVSTRQVTAVAEAVGHTVAARGMCCVYGDTGLRKTVAVEQALTLHWLTGAADPDDWPVLVQYLNGECSASTAEPASSCRAEPSMTASTSWATSTRIP